MLSLQSMFLPVYYVVRRFVTGKDITKKPPAKWQD